MLYSKTNFYKSHPPQLPQQFERGGVLSRKPDYHKTPSPLPLPHYNDTVLYSKTNFYKSQPPQLPQQLGGCYLANRITTKLYLHFPLPHYNDTVLYFKTIFDKSQPPQLPQQLGGCYLANRITTKLYLHFPLPHYNDTVLYFKTIFDKSQPPQYPRHLGGYLKKQGHHKTSPVLTMTSCYILKQISTKANLLDSPNTWGVGLSHKPDYHKTLTSTFPLTILWCYISKRSFTNVNLLNSPNSWGWLSHKPDYHKTPRSPPYNDVVLHSKANFNKSQPPQFPQQKSQNIIFGVTIVAPLIFDQRLKKQNLQSKTNKQTETQGLLVTS